MGKNTIGTKAAEKMGGHGCIVSFVTSLVAPQIE